jgi:hypothetical protein
MTIWMFLGPSYPDRPFSEKLGDAEINTQIHRVLAHGVDLNPGASLTPLMEVVDSTRVTVFAFTSDSLCHLISSWLSRLPIGSCIYSHAPRGVTLPENAPRREANHAYNKRLRASRY